MSTIFGKYEMSPEVQIRANELYEQHRRQIYVRTDQLFAALMILQWIACLMSAWWISPRSWAGPYSQTHIHVWAALILGGIITSLPVLMTVALPGSAITRHTVAVAQMLTSALIIHLMGGRIEAHFHVFGSLAFLAVYRDWRVLITATVVVAVDHLLRGMFWPESVYGVLSTSWFRTFEHSAWVLFEVVILIRAICQSTSEMKEIAVRRAELEMTNQHVEQLVTERTAELRVSEERARTIVNMSNDAFIAMNGKGAIVDWNRAAEMTFGYRHDEVLGSLVSETIIPPASRESHQKGLRRFLMTGDGPLLNRRIEVTARNRSGEEFPAELTITAIPSDNDWLFTAFARDITERQRNEQELKHAKEAAEAASLAKSEFLANMSHEIRTPLNGIVGMVELALDTQLSFGQFEYLNTIKSCADSLLSVINDILDFSKIEAGKLHMDHSAFNLPDLLSDTCRTLGFRADQKGLELACSIGAEVPRLVIGDSGRLRQVLINLVGNAIKFTKQGEVVVQVDRVSQSDKSVELTFAVSDTGIGIAKEKQSQIFKAFEQADSSITRTFGGTGLGLAISSRIVELMNGKIELDSQEGRGSTFSFTAQFDLAPEQECETPSLVSLCSLRILVVDDNQTNRRILTEVLTNWKMHPTVVASGEEALVAMEQATQCGRPFAVVLLDAQMPGMDGFTLIEKIKADPRLKENILMMLSSAAQHSDAERCRGLGVAAYLTKPIKQSELLDTILTVVDSKGRSRTEVKNVPREAAQEPSRKPAKWNILLAEDNPVNQRVASGMLEKRGHTVMTVENGLEALQAVQVQRFDLVLMDLQMPEMDGFAATSAIRALEKVSGTHLPIVAMTARAMKGDRECCLQAGMDGYVAKPINPKELIATIESLVCETPSDTREPRHTENKDAHEQPMPIELATNQAVQPVEAQSNRSAPVDFDALRARVENDATLLEEMIGLYLESSPRLLTEIEMGVQARNAVAVQRSAHALKGALQNLSAGPSAEAALQLELQGRSGNVDSMDKILIELKTELARLQSELSQVFKGVCA